MSHVQPVLVCTYVANSVWQVWHSPLEIIYEKSKYWKSVVYNYQDREILLMVEWGRWPTWLRVSQNFTGISEYLIVKWCKKPKPKRYLQFDTEILGTHASVFYRSVSHQSFLIQASIRSQWHQLHLYRCTRLSLENVGGGIYNADEVWPIAHSLCRTPHFRKEKLVAEVRQMPLVYSGESLTLKWYCSLE